MYIYTIFLPKQQQNLFYLSVHYINPVRCNRDLTRSPIPPTQYTRRLLIWYVYVCVVSWWWRWWGRAILTAVLCASYRTTISWAGIKVTPLTELGQCKQWTILWRMRIKQQMQVRCKTCTCSCAQSILIDTWITNRFLQINPCFI